MARHPKCTSEVKRLCSFDCKRCFNLSFASSDKADRWSPDNELTPRQVFKASRYLGKFICGECDHEFQALLVSITILGSWCPFCSGRTLCLPPDDSLEGERDCMECFNRSFASNPRAKYWSIKNKLTPRTVTKSTKKKFWFQCAVCYHDFEVRLEDCTRRGNWCSFCAGKRLCEDEECEVCYNRSFASSPRVQFWSKKNTEDPRYLMKNSHKRFIFDCDECGHEFNGKLDNITQHDMWCCYCNGDSLCDDEGGKDRCQMCFDRSFASHYRAEYWSPQNKLTPREVRRTSNKKYWFGCPVCLHDFEGILSNIACNDAWCPFCSSPPKRLCPLEEDCDWCFNRSFASHPKAKFWADDNEKQPREVFLNAHTKYTFVCDECHHNFDTTPNHVVNYCWCPVCKLKTEKKLYEWLLQTYTNYKIARQKKFDWCINPETGRKLPFDFQLLSAVDSEVSPILIELDGPQHFIQIHNWEPPEEVQRRDQYKQDSALEQGITLVRLLQEDVLRDVGDWEENLRAVMDDSEGATEPLIYLVYDGNIECKWYG